MALSKTSFGNSILQAREDRLANPDRVNKQKNDRGDRELSGLNRDNMLERRVAQQAAMGPRGGAATGVQPRPAVRTAPQPVSQIAKPLGPGGPQYLPDQLTDILSKVQTQQAAGNTTLGGYPGMPQVDPSTLSRRFNDDMPYYGGGMGGTAPVSNEDINAFVQANLNNPAAIADAARKYGVSQNQLMGATGYSNEQIGSFFQNAGMANPFERMPPQYQQPTMGGTGGGFDTMMKNAGFNIAPQFPQTQQPMMGGTVGQPLAGGGFSTGTQPMMGGFSGSFGPGVNNFSGGTAPPAGAFGSTGSQAAFGSASGGGFNGYSGGGLAALFRKK